MGGKVPDREKGGAMGAGEELDSELYSGVIGYLLFVLKTKKINISTNR